MAGVPGGGAGTDDGPRADLLYSGDPAAAPHGCMGGAGHRAAKAEHRPVAAIRSGQNSNARGM